jgi:Fe2+ or Zn2+ uptake regulation protein
MTGQRRVIAQVLSSATDHPDVEEVHRRANAVDPRISLSTVYRTLRLFSAKGISNDTISGSDAVATKPRWGRIMTICSMSRRGA